MPGRTQHGKHRRRGTAVASSPMGARLMVMMAITGGACLWAYAMFNMATRAL